MTVTPSTSDVADKAVSTDDGGSGMEVARLEAVLAALVETKVEAMKASSTLSRRSIGSAPASPRRSRLTSTSTASSSLNQHHHHHHHHHHHPHPHHQSQQQRKKDHQYHQQHHRHRRRRHDSAPCGDYLNNTTEHSQHKLPNGKERRRASESPRSPRKKRRHSKSPNVLQGVVQDVHNGLDSRFEHLGLNGDQDVALINYERAKDLLDSCDYPRLHRSACYISQSAAQLKIHYDDDDYVTLNVADEFEEEEILSGPARIDEIQGKYHRPRRKRKRKQRKIDLVGPDEELVDPEELPPRARWTIVATACLLLAMSLLLVGVTLRMAPIIDDMGDDRRASICKKTKSRKASVVPRKDSMHSTKKSIKQTQKIIKDTQELEQTRRHRRVAMIILAIFIFLLAAAVLVVVMTLTHSMFLSPAAGSKELTEHRAQLRKENEELLNSLNRDISAPENVTASP